MISLPKLYTISLVSLKGMHLLRSRYNNGEICYTFNIDRKFLLFNLQSGHTNTVQCSWSNENLQCFRFSTEDRFLYQRLVSRIRRVRMRESVRILLDTFTGLSDWWQFYRISVIWRSYQECCDLWIGIYSKLSWRKLGTPFLILVLLKSVTTNPFNCYLPFIPRIRS